MRIIFMCILFACSAFMRSSTETAEERTPEGALEALKKATKYELFGRLSEMARQQKEFQKLVQNAVHMGNHVSAVDGGIIVITPPSPPSSASSTSSKTGN